MTQKQLESLAKTNITTGYPDGMNRSLYSTIGPIENVQITSAKTSYLMLIFSGAALAILLTLFYLPQTRHVLVFGAAAIVTVALAVAYPDFAVLLGEMSTLGIMLAILGIVLYRLASYRTPVKSAVRARSSSDSQASVPSSPPSASGNHSAISTTSMPATETPPPTNLEFQRVYVPENRSKEWPRTGFEFAPQMKLDDFEQLIRQFSQQQDDRKQDLPLQSLTYRASLDGRILQGTAQFTMAANQDAGPGFVSLEESNLFYFDQTERLSPMPNLWVGGSGDRSGVFLQRPQENFTLDWSYQ
ncbi:unnamed protein product, partial [Symbiodinium microadriaticum]